MVVAPADAVIVGNHESTDLRWVDADELAELADEEGILRLARAGLDAYRRSLRRCDRRQLTSPGVTQDIILLTWAKLLIARVMPLVSEPLAVSRKRASSSTRRFSTYSSRSSR